MDNAWLWTDSFDLNSLARVQFSKSGTCRIHCFLERLPSIELNVTSSLTWYTICFDEIRQQTKEITWLVEISQTVEFESQDIRVIWKEMVIPLAYFNINTQIWSLILSNDDINIQFHVSIYYHPIYTKEIYNLPVL